MSDLSDFIKETLIGMNRVRALAETPPPPTRLGRLLELEQALIRLQPDFMEVYDFMDAIMKSLELKYEDGLEDVEECVRWMKEALEEADKTHPAEVELREQELAIQQRVNDEER